MRHHLAVTLSLLLLSSAPVWGQGLSQSVDNTTLTPGLASSCNGGPPLFINGENRYFRSYDLAAEGVTAPIEVTCVSFGVEFATAGGAQTSQPATINLYSSSAPPLGGLTLLTSEPFFIPDGSLYIHSEPLTAPQTLQPSDVVVVELAIPAAGQIQNSFFIGANSLGESAPSHYAAPTCGVNNPVPYNLLVPNVHVIIDLDCRSLDAPAQTLPFFESFDGSASNGTSIAPAGWLNVESENNGALDSDWVFRNTPAVFIATSPPSDHSTGVAGQGFFATMLDVSGSYSEVSLMTPPLQIDGAPTLSYWIYSNNSSPGGPVLFENDLAIDVLRLPSGELVQDIVPPVGHLGQQWNRQIVDLSAFSGERVRVIFRGRTNGGSFGHDLSIDDVYIGPADSGDDFFLSTQINGMGSPEDPTKDAQSGDILTWELDSPNGTFYGLAPFLIGEIYTDGSLPNPIFPGLYISATGGLLLFNGFATPFGLFTIPPGGMRVAWTIPPSVSGSLSFLIQGLMHHPSAQNGIFAATAPHVIDFQ